MKDAALAVLPVEERTFGRYVMLCRIATGGMANLYLARFVGSVGFEKLVAIKRIHDHLGDEAEFLQMFTDEARITARISHPNVVQVIELGTVGKSAYIAMEYVDGETLAALLRRSRIAIPMCVRIAASAAAGLHAAHEVRDTHGELLSVVHRDVSPQNILLSYEGGVKVADFGVARARSNLHQTTAGQVKGKFAYMSPEQVSGLPVDRRSDIFSLGVVLYEMTTSHRLFKAESDAATVAKVQRMEVPPPSVALADYPPALEQIVMQALERDPGARFQTAEEMEEALENYLAASGESATRRELEQLMKSVFEDRIRLKQSTLAGCEKTCVVLPSPDGVVGSSPSLSLQGRTASQAQLQAFELAGRGRARRILLAAAGAAALGVTIALVASFLLKREPSPVAGSAATDGGAVLRPGRPAPSVVREVKIFVGAQPAGAEIRVNGRRVGNPFRLTQPPAPGQLRVEIQAPDRIPRSIVVPLSESGSWQIYLEPKLDAGAAIPTTPRPAKKRPPRKTAPDDDLFGDPSF